MPRNRTEKLIDRAVAPVILVAIVASFVLGNKESADRDRAQAKQLVLGCERTSKRAAYLAASNYDVARARVARGEPAEARKAAALGDGVIWTIPVPKGVTPTPALAAVTYTKDGGGRTVAQLTPEALRLQAKGCEAAFL